MNLEKEIDKRIKKNQPLKNFTTMGVGGNASFLLEIDNHNIFEKALISLTENKIPYLILGKGSNVIISDDGFDGVVIINKIDNIKIVEEDSICQQAMTNYSRLDKSVTTETHHDGIKNSLIRVDSGMLISSLTQKLYKKNISGLEWYAGIPATVGGAVYMNMHGGNYFFSDMLVRAKIFSGNKSKIVDYNYFKFDYDYSILHTTKEIILWVELCLPNGDIEESKKVYKDWSKKKSNQPQKSAGCVFRNITKEEKEKLKLPSVSIGYILDNIMGLKGFQIGGAKISEKHAAFIENTGKAAAQDVYNLVQYIKEKVFKKLQIKLITEIEFIGKF
jgi:UDP-N-acetylmuramate dehydrogenase